MAEEFNIFLESAKKSPLDEKVNAFGSIIEKIMSIVLRIPDLVDNSLNGINQQISSLESRINAMNGEINSLKTRGVAAPGASIGSPPPPPPGSMSGGPLGAPPPPPGAPPPPGPPGSPPPPPGGPRAAPERPANPVSLRGAIMGELKQLFAKRKR